MSGFNFKINNINLITSSRYISPLNSDCTICRYNINNDSIYAKEKGIRSKINTGKCGHIFHEECILQWLQNNNKCPICMKIFIS